MSVVSICNAVQDAIAASTRITRAPHIDAWPAQIDAADLPLSLTRPGPGSWPHDALDDVWHRRTYFSEIYVKPNALGLYAEGVAETLDIIQDLGHRFTASSSGYTLDGAVIDSEPRDRGLAILTYGGAEYRGTMFELDITEDAT